MITRKEIDLAAPLTTPQIEMLTALAAAPSTADVDCPELTAAQQNSFYRLIRNTDSRFISCDTDTSKKQRPFLKQSPVNLFFGIFRYSNLLNTSSKHDAYSSSLIYDTSTLNPSKKTFRGTFTEILQTVRKRGLYSLWRFFKVLR